MDDDKVEAIMLLMGMTDPMCPECYEYLRAKEFVFTGCVPGGDDDMIVLEYLKKPVDRAFLAIEPDYERVLDMLYEINGEM